MHPLSLSPLSQLEVRWQEQPERSQACDWPMMGMASQSVVACGICAIALGRVDNQTVLYRDTMRNLPSADRHCPAWLLPSWQPFSVLQGHEKPALYIMLPSCGLLS